MQAVMVLFFGALTVWQSKVFVFRGCWINVRSQRNGEILILSPILQTHHKHSWTLLLSQNLRIQLREFCDQFRLNRNQFHLMYPDTKNGATFRMPRLTSE